MLNYLGKYIFFSFRKDLSRKWAEDDALSHLGVSSGSEGPKISFQQSDMGSESQDLTQFRCD